MSRYMVRLLAFCFMLGAIPVISIGIISYSIASNDIEDKVKESNMQILQQTQMRMEQTFKTLELAALQYVNSPIVRTSIQEPLSADNFLKVRDLTTGLYNLQITSGINDAMLISMENDWVVSFLSMKRLSALPDQSLYLEYAKHPNSLFWVTNGSIAPGGAEEGVTVPAVSMIYKIPIVPMTSQPRGLLVVKMLHKDLQTIMTSNNRLGTFYVLNQEGNDFLSSQSFREQYADINARIKSAVGDSRDAAGFLDARLGREEVGVSYKVSPYNGWIYVSVVSIEQITKQSKKIALVTWFMCVIILAAVSLLAFFGGRRMYRPVRRLFEFTQEIEADRTKTSGEGKADEFGYIENSLRALSRTGKQLEQQLKGNNTQLKEFFMLKLYTGQMTEKDFADRAKLYSFPTEWKRLGVLTLQIDTFEHTRFQEHDKELLLFAINNMVGELFAGSRSFSPVLLDQSQVTLVTIDSEDPAEMKAMLHQAAELIKSKVYEYLQLKVSLGISHPFSRLSETVKAYGESLAALKGRMSLGDDIILHYDDIDSRPDAETTVYTHLKVMEERVLHFLKAGEADNVSQAFQVYRDAILEREGSYNELPVLMVQLIAKVYQLIQDQGVPVKKVLGETATVDNFLKLTSQSEVMQWFHKRLFGPVIEFMNEQSESQYVNIANQMTKLIHDKYLEDISLESCAAHLNFHPVYVSRVFKKELGVTFSEYVADYRMNVAKSWLETTQLKISEIGEKLQYTNTSAFIRTFRKVVGMTPGQYRDLHQKK